MEKGKKPKLFQKLVLIMSFKLVPSICRPKQSNNSSVKRRDGAKGGSYNHIYYGPAALYTKPEVAKSDSDHRGGPSDFKSEHGGSLDLESLVGSSEQFTNVFTGTHGRVKISIREEPKEETDIHSKKYTLYINNYEFFD